jgi:hypothetical protein
LKSALTSVCTSEIAKETARQTTASFTEFGRNAFINSGTRFRVVTFIGSNSSFTKTVAVRCIEIGIEIDQQSFWVSTSFLAQSQAAAGMLFHQKPRRNTKNPRCDLATVFLQPL